MVTHAIARMRAPDEKPCGEYLMLWEDRRFTLSGQVDVVLLCARTGAAVARTLIAPSVRRAARGSAMSESQQAVVVEFHRGGIAAIDYAPASGVIAASNDCSRARTSTVSIHGWMAHIARASSTLTGAG